MSAQLDAGLREEAMRTGTAAMQLAKKHVPDQVVPTFKLLVCASVVVIRMGWIKYLSILYNKYRLRMEQEILRWLRKK